MRKNWIALAIAALVLLVGSGLVLADDSRGSTPNLPRASLGEMYDRSSILPGGDESPVRLPRPVGDSMAANVESAVSGPIASYADTGIKSGDISGAFAQPRGGGSIYSEKERADHEIRRLIRRLD